MVRPNGTYDVMFSSGDRERRMPPSSIRSQGVRRLAADVAHAAPAPAAAAPPARPLKPSAAAFLPREEEPLLKVRNNNKTKEGEATGRGAPGKENAAASSELMILDDDLSL